MPYSNRPQYGEPQIPRAPRSPAFPEPSARGGHQWNQTGPHPSQQYVGGPGSYRVPGAPHSLSPVAMASARGAIATGPQAAMMMDNTPPRPSAKAGMSILFAGAIIGGLIGAVMHARQNAADAFAHQPDPIVVVAPSASAPIFVPPKVLDPAPQPRAEDKKVADDKKDDKKVDDKKKTTTKKWAWAGPKAATGAKSTDTDKSDAPEKPTASKKKGGNKDDDGYTVAGAGSSEDKPEKTETKAEKPTKKSETKAEKPEKADKPEKKKDNGKGDDAVNVLKAAMGATENTL